MQKARSLRRFKQENEERLASEKILVDRRRNLLVLSLEYLNECRLGTTFEALEREAGIACSKFAAAGGIDLQRVLTDFEAYHQIKHNKKPVYFRERVKSSGPAGRAGKKPGSSGGGAKRSNSSRRAPSASASEDASNQQDLPPPERKSIRELRAEAKKTPVFKQPNRPKKQQAAAGDAGQEDGAGIGNDGGGLSVGAVGINNHTDNSAVAGGTSSAAASANEAARERRQRRMQYNPSQMPAGLGVPLALKGRGAGPVSGPAGAALLPASKAGSSERAALVQKLPYAMDSESHQLAMTISRDVHVSVSGITFDDVVGLEGAKQLLQEAVVFPVKYPELFTGLLSPWKGILLYGPPGTGKTMLAKAVAAECKTTFFNISASSIVSKFRGDSEKLVRVLFELARLHAPSTIFMDEIDAILGQRGTQEHEASRRLKTELLIQMDGLNKTDDLVFLLAASNLPWSLDFALLRRLEKRVYVGLPDIAARRTIAEKLIPPSMCSGVDYNEIAEKTAQFSGSDMHLLCKESAMGPLRRLMHKLDLTTLETTEDDEAVQLGEITMDDIVAALESTRPSSNVEESKYAEWAAKHGSE